MTRWGHLFTACHMLAPSAGLPDSSYTTRHRRPPARGGPTLYDRLWRGTSRPYRVGPPLAGLHGEVFGWIGLGSRWRSVPKATLSVGLSSDFTTNFPKKPSRVSPLRVACAVDL